jgi:monofunctional biosynthetic peptidoglycan transglycosylase
MRKSMRKFGRGVAVVLAAAFAYAAYLYLSLPDVRSLRTTNPSMTAFQRIRANEARRRGGEPKHVQKWVGYARISPHLKRAVLVTEDAKFWRHDGLDLEQLKASIEVNIERGEFARGGSTITQQLAKNLYLSPAKNPIRKLRELLIARRLEAELTKQRIYEIYLNVIEWGNGIYGAEAAARTYFGKSAAALGPSEAALLAAAIANPRVLNPAHPSARLRQRQQMVARWMGAVTPPPVLPDATSGAPSKPLLEEPIDAVPALPPEALPAVLPGEPVREPPGPAKPCENPPCR